MIEDAEGRFFCELVNIPSLRQWGMNLIHFEDGQVIQSCIGKCGQEAVIQDFDYNDGVLTFVVEGGHSVEMEINEIDPSVGRNLLKPHNWEALGKGLGMQSEKTMNYLRKRGIELKRSKAREAKAAATHEPAPSRKGRLPEVVCTLENCTIDNGTGPVKSVRAVCPKCGHEEESFGRGEASVRRCLVMLNRNCPNFEKNYYKVDEIPEVAPIVRPRQATMLDDAGKEEFDDVDLPSIREDRAFGG